MRPLEWRSAGTCVLIVLEVLHDCSRAKHLTRPTECYAVVILVKNITYNYWYSITPHSFVPGLKPSSSASPSHRTFFFSFRTDSADSQTPDCLPILLSISVFTARCYASAVLAMGLCPSVCLSVSVCLSQAGVLLKRLNV